MKGSAPRGVVVLLAAVLGCTTSGTRCGPPPPPVTPLEAVPPGATLREVFESLPVAATSRLRLLEGNDEAWVERWRLLSSAERTLDVAYFILDQDVFGASFLGSLRERARNGVRVRVLLDAYGTDLSRTFRGNDYLDALVESEKIDVRMYRPLHRRFLEGLLRLSVTVALASEHDKIVAVDGERFIAGGRNVSAEYFADPATHPKAFLDTDVLVEGAETTAAAIDAFDLEYRSDRSVAVEREVLNLEDLGQDLELARRAMDAWLRDVPFPEDVVRDVGKRGLPWLDQLREHEALRGALDRPPPPSLAAETRWLDSPARFGRADDPITRGILRLVRAAREEIVAQSPYLVLSEEGVDLLRAAGERGVETTIVTNSPTSSDNALSQAFFLEQWPRILAAVPNLRLYAGGTRHNLHSKIAAFDGVLSIVSTYNLDPTSMVMNGELALVVWSPEIAKRIAAIPRHKIEKGPPAVYEYTIRRDAKGAPVLRDGDPIVTFGPADHEGEIEWTRLEAYWALLRAADEIPLVTPFF